MSTACFESGEFTNYRNYLHFLAREHLPKRYLGKIDQSDIVQQVLLKAYVARGQFRGQSEGERLAWLRRILVRSVAHATRDLHSQRRDINREQPLAANVRSSSRRLNDFLAVDQSSPSQNLLRQEKIQFVAEAIERLPKDQREVVILRYRNQSSIQELATALGKSTSAIASLLHRANKNLRDVLEKHQS